jgi:SSS family solute:Na+ symporter
MGASASLASNIGSEHLVGLGGGASSGMAMAHWEMHGWLILLLGWLFVPFYARSESQCLNSLRGDTTESRSVLSIISLVLCADKVLSLFMRWCCLQDVFGIESIWGIDFFWISAVRTCRHNSLYTTLGGMKAIL